jgi:hypothetical protein
MIRTMLASKTAKMIATCVCPVAGTTAVTMAVPQVKQAVHKATAPRAYAKPKTRVRPAALAPCPDPMPVLLGGEPEIAALPIGPLARQANPFVTGPGAPVAGVPVVFGPGAPGGDGLIPVVPGPGVPVAGVPDGETWVQLIVGFGLIGGATRLAVVRDKPRIAPPVADQNGLSPMTLPPSA